MLLYINISFPLCALCTDDRFVRSTRILFVCLDCKMHLGLLSAQKSPLEKCVKGGTRKIKMKLLFGLNRFGNFRCRKTRDGERKLYEKLKFRVENTKINADADYV